MDVFLLQSLKMLYLIWVFVKSHFSQSKKINAEHQSSLPSWDLQTCWTNRPAGMFCLWKVCFFLWGQSAALTQFQSWTEALCSGSPVPKLRWRKVDGLLPAKSGSSGEGPTLTLPDLSFDDEGIYECEAYNSQGTDTYQGRISVQGNETLDTDFTLLWVIFWIWWIDSPLWTTSIKTLFSCFSSAAVATGNERLRGRNQLRTALELHRCWQTQTVCTLASQWTVNQHAGSLTSYRRARNRVLLLQYIKYIVDWHQPDDEMKDKIF